MSQIRLSPIIQQNVVTYNVVVAVDNRDLKLMPGMTAYIYIDVDKREDALLVPSSALRFRPRDMPPEPKKAATPPAPGEKKQRGGSARVYVARGDKLVPVTIQTGLSDGKMVEVTGGELKAGDRVATQNRVPDSGGGAPAAGQQPRVRAF